MKKTLVLLSLFASVSAFAQTSTQGGPPPHERNPAFEAAMQACRASAGQDASGRPNHQAFDACMESKGFHKPAGGPHGGPPPQQ